MNTASIVPAPEPMQPQRMRSNSVDLGSLRGSLGGLGGTVPTTSSVHPFDRVSHSSPSNRELHASSHLAPRPVRTPDRSSRSPAMDASPSLPGFDNGDDNDNFLHEDRMPNFSGMAELMSTRNLGDLLNGDAPKTQGGRPRKAPPLSQLRPRAAHPGVLESPAASNREIAQANRMAVLVETPNTHTTHVVAQFANPTASPFDIGPLSAPDSDGIVRIGQNHTVSATDGPQQLTPPGAVKENGLATHSGPLAASSSQTLPPHAPLRRQHTKSVLEDGVKRHSTEDSGRPASREDIFHKADTSDHDTMKPYLRWLGMVLAVAGYMPISQWKAKFYVFLLTCLIFFETGASCTIYGEFVDEELQRLLLPFYVIRMVTVLFPCLIFNVWYQSRHDFQKVLASSRTLKHATPGHIRAFNRIIKIAVWFTPLGTFAWSAFMLAMLYRSGPLERKVHPAVMAIHVLSTMFSTCVCAGTMVVFAMIVSVHHFQLTALATSLGFYTNNLKTAVKTAAAGKRYLSNIRRATTLHIRISDVLEQTIHDCRFIMLPWATGVFLLVPSLLASRVVYVTLMEQYVTLAFVLAGMTTLFLLFGLSMPAWAINAELTLIQSKASRLPKHRKLMTEILGPHDAEVYRTEVESFCSYLSWNPVRFEFIGIPITQDNIAKLGYIWAAVCIFLYRM